MREFEWLAKFVEMQTLAMEGMAQRDEARREVAILKGLLARWHDWYEGDSQTGPAPALVSDTKLCLYPVLVVKLPSTVD